MAGKIGAMADKAAGWAERMGEAAEKTDVTADTMDGVYDKFAPISVVVGTRVAQLFAQAGDVQMVSNLTAWNGRTRDDGRGFCLKMLQK